MNYTIELDRWEKMMVDYGFFHQKAVNLITHFIGVPVIVASVLLALTWVEFTTIKFAGVYLPVNLALIAAIGLGAFYISLDRSLGILSIPFLTLLLIVSNQLNGLGFSNTWIIVVSGFFGGFALQFIGHAIEGKKPALIAYNPIIAMITSPLFIVAEFGSVIGVRKEMFKKVKEEIERLERG